MARQSVHNPITTAYHVDQCDDIEQLRAFAQRVLAAFYASHKQTTHTFERHDCEACTEAYDEMDSGFACDDWKAWQKDVTAGIRGDLMPTVHPMDHISEATFQKLVEQLCINLGMPYYHTRDSRGSVAGFPDLAIITPAGLLLAELKSDTGKLSRSQKAWIDAAIITGTRVRIWRPSDWRNNTIQTQLRELCEDARGIIRVTVSRCAQTIRDEQRLGATRRSMRPAVDR